MSAAALGLAGLVAGALLGWLAARRGVRRGPPAAFPLVDSPFEPGPRRGPRISGSLRAVDAATDLGLPPDAKLDVLARMLVERAAERTGMPCAVALRDTDEGPINIVAQTGDLDPRLLGVRVDPDSSAGHAVTDGVPMVAPADESVVRGGMRDRRRPLRGGLAVPIRSTSRVEGALLALGPSPLAPAEALVHLEELVRRFSPNLLPAHAVAVAERKAATDELTGLSNRRALKLAMETADARRSAMIILDLDHFKSVNDTHGHPAGDVALKHVAQVIRTALRAGDVAARIGGEEFAVWLPGADLALGLEVAERLRALLAAKRVRISGQEQTLTVSCGVAASPVPIPHPDNLMAAADGALYRAKREGRNRVVASGAPAS